MEALLADSARALSALLMVAAVLLARRWWQEHQRRAVVRRRLRAIATSSRVSAAAASELLRRDQAPITGWLRAVLGSVPLLRDSERLLEQAGLAWSPRRFGKLTLLTAAAGGLVVLAGTGSPVAAAAGVLGGSFLPILVVLRKKARRVSAMEAQLPEVIDLLTRAVRAGHAVPTGMRMVAEEGPAPLAGEFRRVFEEQKYGYPFEEALLGLARRVDLVDIRVMVVAILIQREVGGNLTEILDNIAGLLRSRFTLRRQLRVHAAQGRASGYVLGILPIAVAGILFLMNPGYIGMLVSDPVGKSLLMAAAGLQLVGYFWIWRILQIDI